MPTLSYLAWRLSAHGTLITDAGMVAMLLSTIGLWLTARREAMVRGG
jgi:hypothetical protein